MQTESHAIMENTNARVQTKMTRRTLLKSTCAFGSLCVVGGSFIAAPNAAWALNVKHLKPRTMATLVQMARDIYPHDRVGDEFYVIAVKGYDTKNSAPEIEKGIAALDAAAGGHYAMLGWEAERVAVLRSQESTAFFQKIRGNLITGLYNQKAIWPIFGYEGESFSKGGYIDHGFNNINWL